jgi:hypothetical protein
MFQYALVAIQNINHAPQGKTPTNNALVYARHVLSHEYEKYSTTLRNALEPRHHIERNLVKIFQDNDVSFGDRVYTIVCAHFPQ